MSLIKNELTEKSGFVMEFSVSKEAYDKADIVVFLTAHKEFLALEYDTNKITLDFCGVFKR